MMSRSGNLHRPKMMMIREKARMVVKMSATGVVEEEKDCWIWKFVDFLRGLTKPIEGFF